MQLSEIVSNVNAELQPVSNIDDLIKKWANQGQKEFVSSDLSTDPHEFSWMKINRLSLTTVANQSEYVISPLIDHSKVLSFYEEDIERDTIEVISRREFQERYPDPLLAIGEPDVAYLSSYAALQLEPTSASVLTFVSTDIQDTQVINLKGLNENGVLITEDITLNGTTPVVTTNQFTRLINRGISGFTMGIITVTSNGGAVTNDVIQPRNRQNRYAQFTFYPVPGQSKTIFYDGMLKLPELVLDDDMSLIPEQYHDAIEDYCLYRGFRHKKDLQGSQEALVAFERRRAQAISDDRGPITRTIVGGQIRRFEYLKTGKLPGLF